MKTLPFLLATLLTLVISACSNAQTPLTGEWKLISYGSAANPTPAIADVDTSISFNDGKFGGTVGCNSFGADYTSEGSSIHIGSVVSTMMFCEATSAQESAVLGILSDKTLNVSVSGDQLKLVTEDGASVIVLEKK